MKRRFFSMLWILAILALVLGLAACNKPATDAPTGDPTGAPTDAPTGDPTGAPTDAPTGDPTATPTDAPTGDPTSTPTDTPTNKPTDPAPDNEVIIEELLTGGDFWAENGRNGAKITVCATFSEGADAIFDRLELYKGDVLVLVDDTFEGFGEYSDLNTKTQYTVKLYYSSEEKGYSGKVKEFALATPAYDLPEVDGYSSERNVVVGNHAIFHFAVEKYTDLVYYDIIVRGYDQNDAYFAPFILEMLDDPGLLGRLEQGADKEHSHPGSALWEAQDAMDRYLAYLQAWEHKERAGYPEETWREIAATQAQYTYELSIENGGLILANDGDFVNNYYAILRDYLAYEEMRFDIYLQADLGDGQGIREINRYGVNPYFRGMSDGSYDYRIQEDETVKNGHFFTETEPKYQEMYVYRLALYQNGEYICDVPFTSGDVESVDTNAWLEAWIEKLKCEIPDVTPEEMIRRLGPGVVREILEGLWFEAEWGNDVTVDGSGNAIIGGKAPLGNEDERALLAALGADFAEALRTLFVAQTQEEKTLADFIAESDNQTVVCVLQAFRETVEITEQNAYAIFAAIAGVYEVSDQLVWAYENAIREEYAAKEIPDPLAAIPPITFRFQVGTDLAPAGKYVLCIFFRSVLRHYEGEEAEEPHYYDLRIRRILTAPTDVEATEDGRRLTWCAVEGAWEYLVYVNGEYRDRTNEPVYHHNGTLKTGDIVQIMASGSDAYDSLLSREYTFVQPKLGKPTVRVSGPRVSWGSVENASKYMYTVNGQEYETRNEEIRVYQNATVRIKAVDENGFFEDSEWVSVTVSYSSADKGK